MKFKVISDKIESYTKQGQSYTNRKLTVLGADEDLSEQLCLITLPADHAEVGSGTEIDFHVREISSIFSGKPQLRGEIVA